MVKKNGAKVYRGRLVHTPQYRRWAESAALFVNAAVAMMGQSLPISRKVQMKALFYFENGSSEPDLSALYEGIQDVLQSCGVLVNDKQIYSHDGSTKIIGQSPRLEVFLFSLD